MILFLRKRLFYIHVFPFPLFFPGEASTSWSLVSRSDHIFESILHRLQSNRLSRTTDLRSTVRKAKYSSALKTSLEQKKKWKRSKKRKEKKNLKSGKWRGRRKMEWNHFWHLPLLLFLSLSLAEQLVVCLCVCLCHCPDKQTNRQTGRQSTKEVKRSQKRKEEESTCSNLWTYKKGGKREKKKKEKIHCVRQDIKLARKKGRKSKRSQKRIFRPMTFRVKRVDASLTSTP